MELTSALGKLKVRKRETAQSTEGRQLAELQPNTQIVEQYKEKKVLQWFCNGCQKPCLQIREESRCICGHRLKYHNDKGKRKCKENGCPCKGFFYIVAEGSWILRCQCKHKGVDHDPNTHACKRRNCGCTKFKSPWVCNCDCPWSMHEQQEATIMVKTFSVNNDEFKEINPWQDLKRGIDHK
ncbi:hypothetical protein A3770_02p16510 [Chloropicon primus]|uniref:Protein FAM221A n=2 Tax=Chloropicon primus TaxID=1764295 RepID=A0A5B8MF94_9CHLO|nr:hypothetical protein A3770_02p16510 [Chloropicon primus]|eukprot:QDZ19133.1 hypothetical protein A3770_02p16510 [Chloropicon primus]